MCLLSRAKIEISIEYTEDALRAKRIFEHQLGEVVMRICDVRSKEKCATIEANRGEITLKQMGTLTLMECGLIIDKKY